MENAQLKIKCWDLRRNLVDIVMQGRCGHIGGDMSCLDIIMSIYDRMNINPNDSGNPNRDRFVLSKGHCVEALYAVLADKGFLNLDDILATYSKYQSKYIGHPNNKLNGIEMNTGSLGHGLSIGVGMALAAKMNNQSYRTYIVMGDGELAEGSVWEAAMAASNFNLDNLCAVVDRNHLQISGNTESVMKQDSVSARFEAFNWNVIELNNGNDIDQIVAALDAAEASKGKPTIIIANTTKGFGASIMENKAEWHHKVLTEESYQCIIEDLLTRKEATLHE